MPQVDSAWHPVRNRHALEWWYFTLLCDDGDIFAGRLWVGGDHVTGLDCGMELYAYPKDGPPWEFHDLHGHDSFYAATDRLLVMVEANALEQRGEKIRLDIRREELVLHIEGTPVHDWKTPVIRHHLNRRQGLLWTIPMLRGGFKGTIRKGAGLPERQLQGTMFHDHVLADVSPSLDAILNYRGWCWGLVYQEERTMLFIDAEYRRVPLRLACIADGRELTVIKNRPDMPFSITPSVPPIITIDDGEKKDRARLTRLYRKRHSSVRSRGQEWLFNSVLGVQKLHGAGLIDSGSLYFEMLRMHRG